MVDSQGGKTGAQGKPRRYMRNYLLDRKFQFKYALLLSGASALLMAVMGSLLFVKMRDSERRLEDEARIAHAGIAAAADDAGAMLRREMDASAQQLISQKLPCVAPPSCPPAAQPGTAAGVVTQGTAAACDVETCRPICEALGLAPAPAGTGTGAGAEAEAEAEAETEAETETETETEAGAPGGPGPEAESGRAPEPAAADVGGEQQRQRDLIRKIEETVRGETEQRAREMEAETRERLAGLDTATQERLSEMRAANRRDLNAILVALVVIFLVLAVVGIVVTHRVVGPIYRMKMLFGKIDGDHLMLQGALRKGDELQDLFLEVHKMLDRLRAHQQDEITDLEALLGRLGKAEQDDDRRKVVADLQAFRDRMARALEKK